MKSLLWPGGRPPIDESVAPAWLADLGVSELLEGLFLTPTQRTVVRETLSMLVRDGDTIAARQAVLADLLASPELVATIQRMVPKLDGLGRSGQAQRFQRGSQQHELLQLADRFRELEMYVEIVTELQAVLEAARPASPGLQGLLGDLDALSGSSEFRQLQQELPGLSEPLQGLRSVTVGINLDDRLRPESATLLSLNEHRMTGSRSLLGRLFGAAGDPDDRAGLTRLRAVASDDTPFASELFRDLDHLVAESTKALNIGLRRYSGIALRPLAALAPEFLFLLAGVELVARLGRLGLPTCLPEWDAPEQRTLLIEDGYDVSLALRLGEGHAALILNPVELGPPPEGLGRVAILTGPNRGGKTTYLRQLGLTVVLAQAGLPVPGRRARLSPVDTILTHFPATETHQPGMGRFDEEARRLAQLFQRASPFSLALLNESLSSTAPGEAAALLRGLVRGLQALGARAVVVTHLYNMTFQQGRLDGSNSEPPVFTLVASSEGGHESSEAEVGRSYRIRPGPPATTSRADEVARLYGLTWPQLAADLRRRGIEVRDDAEP